MSATEPTKQPEATGAHSVDRRVGRRRKPPVLIVMPEGVAITQCWCNDQCDMLQGPCACGVWHKLKDWPEHIRSLAPNPKLTDDHETKQ